MKHGKRKHIAPGNSFLECVNSRKLQTLLEWIIENYLTSELQNIDEQSELNAYVRSMRNACNKFLSKCPDKKEFRCYACQPGNIDNWIFTSAIGELRGVFGVMIGQIAKAYGLDVEDDLAQIIPE